MHSVSKITKSAFLSLCAVLALSSVNTNAAFAASNDQSLFQAQELEANGQYALAASAYLAIVEGYDFMPGPSNEKELAKLTKEQKVIVGKCAMNCIEQGIHNYLDSNSGNLADCPEFQLLGGASITMMELDPKNAKWTYLRAFTQLKKGNYDQAEKLLDRCIAISANDESVKNMALKSKSELKALQLVAKAI